MKTKKIEGSLLIGISAWDTVCGEFFGQFLSILDRLYQLHEKNKKFIFKICFLHHQSLMESRTKIVQEALDSKTDWILFLDTDSIIKINTIEKMIETLENNNLDVLSCVFFKKKAPHQPVILHKEDGFLYFEHDFLPNRGLIQVDAVGFGCTLIRTSIFETIDRPWFKITEKILEGNKRCWEGEDIYFSEKATAKGYKLWVDTGLVEKHWGKSVSFEDYLQHRNALIILKQDRDEILTTLKSFLGQEYNMDLSKRDLKIKCMESEELIIAKKEENLSFEEWLFERTDWHLWQDQRKVDVEITFKVLQLLHEFGELQILSLERGIGQIPYMIKKYGRLDEVDCVIPDDDFKLATFLQYRGLNVKKVADLEKHRYDVIIASDFFEHLSDKIVSYYIEKVKNSMKKGAKFVMKTAPHSNRHKHYLWTDKRKKIVFSLGKVSN
jgi:hypothetical protein